MQRIMTWEEKQPVEEQQGFPCGFSRLTAVSNRDRLALNFTVFQGYEKILYRCGSERTVSVMWSWKESRLAECRGSKRGKTNTRYIFGITFHLHLWRFIVWYFPPNASLNLLIKILFAALQQHTPKGLLVSCVLLGPEQDQTLFQISASAENMLSVRHV